MRRFDPQPVLKGSLLELRPLRADDQDALFAAASDPLIWEQHPQRNRHEPEVFRGYFAEQLASGGALIVLDAQTGEAIGLSRYNGHDAERSEVEIGWTFLVRRCWGGVYNRELKDLMLGHAFLSVDSVVCASATLLSVAVTNAKAASRRCPKVGEMDCILLLMTDLLT